MILTIDFETRSACDLRKSGAYRYAQDPSTDVMCLAFKPDDEPTRLWIPEWAQEVFGKADDRFLLGYHLDEADEIFLVCDMVLPTIRQTIRALQVFEDKDGHF